MTWAKRKNIMMVANFASDVGYAWWLMENFWSQTALHFAKEDRKCILIYPRVTGVPKVIKDARIQVVEHALSERGFRSLLKLIRLIKRNEIGYLYLTDQAYFDWIYLLMRACGIRRIVNHDHTPGERSRVSPLKRVLKKSIHFLRIFSCDFYIGVSKFVVARTITTACVPISRCGVVYNGIELFDNARSDYAQKALGVPARSTIVVTTGRATAYKGIDLLVRAAAVLLTARGVENLAFLHIGDGPHLQDFKKLAVELGVENKFFFGGHRSDVVKILPCCDIAVQVSHGEGFSLSILEYMYAGLATLAPRNCGNAEAIEDGVNGMLFEPGNVEEIAEKIISLLSDPQLAERMKKAARETVARHFTLQRCNRDFLSLLDRQFS